MDAASHAGLGTSGLGVPCSQRSRDAQGPTTEGFQLPEVGTLADSWSVGLSS